MAIREVIDSYTEGDTDPLVVTFAEGTVDITGFTITFNMRLPNGTVLTKSTTIGDVVITDGAAGEFEVQWVTTDLVEGGDLQESEFRLLNTLSKLSTFNDIFFDVRAALG